MIRFFIMLLVAAGIAEIISIRRSLFGIEYDVDVSKKAVEPDEKVNLITKITNRSRRFVPFLRIEEDVPLDMLCDVGLEIENFTQRRASLRSSVYLLPRQRVIRKTEVSFSKRGLYAFKGAVLSGGDFLGFSERSQRSERMCTLVVLPRRGSYESVKMLIGGMLGDESVNRFLNEDPMLTLGFHEYTGREPMKRISWKRTAREGKLMVREPDHTLEQTAVVLVNTNTFAFGHYGEELLEKCFSIARDIMETLEEMRIPYAFLSNVSSVQPAVSEGLGKMHLNSALVALGTADYGFSESVWSLIDRAVLAADSGKTIILITPMQQDLKNAEVERIALRTGMEPKIIYAMEEK